MATTHREIMGSFTPERRKAIRKESARLESEHFQAADEWDAKQAAKKSRKNAETGDAASIARQSVST